MPATAQTDYLDEAGLNALWAKIKATFVLKAGDTMTGALTTTTLTISSTTGEKHIAFSRSGGMNYITAPSTGSIGIMVADTLSANNTFEFIGNVFRPYKNKEKSIGDSTHYWNDIYGTTIYENGTSLAAKYAGITLESYFANGILKSDNMPTATSSVLGGVKVGSTLAISSGTLNQKSGICTAGTYRSVTVDTYGRVTAGTNPTTLAGYEISDANINGDVITLGSNTITGITSDEQSFYGQKTFRNKTTIGYTGSPGVLSLFNRDSTQTSGRNVMRFAEGYDWLIIGDGTNAIGYETHIYGTSIKFRYATSSTVGVTLNSSGNLGIGTESPSTKLHVNGTASVDLLKITNTSASKHIEFSRSGLNYITVPNNAYLYISMNGAATTTKAYRFAPADFEPSANAIMSLGTSSLRWNNIYGTVLDISGATTLGSTLSVTGGTTLGSFLKMPNDQYISFKNSGGTDIRSVAMGGNNAFLLGDYQNNGGIPTHIHGSLVTLNVGGVKKAEVDSLGVTSYGGVAAMGIADLSIN